MKKNLKSKINQTVNAKIMEQKVFKTAYQEEQEAKDMAIYNEWNELMSVPGQSATGVTQHLMQKYNIHSSSTIWVMRKRAEKGRENYEYKVKPRSCTSQVRVQQEIPATVLGEKSCVKTGCCPTTDTDGTGFGFPQWYGRPTVHHGSRSLEQNTQQRKSTAREAFA